MKGVGYFDDRAYYYPSSSNLSAFAQPFSVNKTTPSDVSAPCVDLAESTDVTPLNQFPVHSRPYGYDFFPNPVRELDSVPSSKAYGYSVSQVLDPPSSQLPNFNTMGLPSEDTFAYDQSTNNIKSSLFEAQPYYPSYVLPSTHGVNPLVPDHWSNLEDIKKKSEIGFSGVGLWNQFGEFNQGNSSSTQAEAGGSFFPEKANVAGPVIEENLLNQGYQDAKASNIGNILPRIDTLGWENHGVGVPVSADQLEDKLCLWQTASSLPFNITSTSIQGSPLASHDTPHDNHLKLVTDSASYHSSYNASADRLMVQHDIPSLVDAGSSAPISRTYVGSSVGNITAGGNIGSNDITNVKETYLLTSPRSSGCFDSGHIRMHLNKDESTSANNVMLPDSHVATGVVDFIFKARNEFQNPPPILNNLSLGFRTDEGVNLKSFDNVDKCNLAVDSPCWKGVSPTHFHSFDGSETLYPERAKSNEENFSLNFEGPQNFRLDASNISEMSSVNSKNNQIDSETDYLEKGLAGTSRNFLVANLSSEGNNLDGAASTRCFDSKTIYDCGLQYLEDNSEMTENDVPSNKSTYDSESRISYEQQIMEEKMSPKQHSLSGVCVDGEMNGNEYLKYFASHAAEPSPSLPSSTVGAPAALEESAAKASTPKINIQILVDTMKNLSELLLFHCSNDTCELKENDRSVLSYVISNLNTCASKNAGQMFPVQECAFPLPNPSKYVRESCELGQNAKLERPHLTKVDPEGSKDRENLHVQEMKAHHFASGKLGTFCDSLSAKGDTNMMEEDNVIKALKRTLTENFQDEEGEDSRALLYKNLWLEAEAAICSMKCRVRYDQMKSEMDKFSGQRDVEEQSKLDDPVMSSAHSSAAKGNIVPNPNYSAGNLPDLNAANFKELSSLKFSPDLNKPCTLTPDDNGGQNLGSFILDSVVLGRSENIGECEATTKATFYSCNYGDVNTCINVANLKEQLNSEASHAHDRADKLAFGQTDNEDRSNFTEISRSSGSKADYVPPVMARFHILKSRDEESRTNTTDIEELPTSVVSRALNQADISSYGLTDSKIQATDFMRGNKDDDHASSVMSRFHILRSRDEESCSNTVDIEEQPSSVFSHALNPVDKSSVGLTDGKIQATDSTQVNKDDDHVSSVMARFHILKSRDEGSCSNTADIEEPPSFLVSHALNADKSSFELTDGKIEATDFTQANKVVSSVRALLQALKSQAVDSSSMSSEGLPLDGVESAGNRPDFMIPDYMMIRDASEAHNSNFSFSPPIMHLSSYAAVEPSTPKEFHANLEGGQEIQPQGTSRFGVQLPAYYSDGYSSDWEHVKMEEFAWQSSKS